MFPAVLVKNDAFGAESVNHNSAMHIAGWETHADVHLHHQAAQSQSLASENVASASPGALSLCAHCRSCNLDWTGKGAHCTALQFNAVISALALILGKVRLCIKVSGSQSNCWKTKCTSSTQRHQLIHTTASSPCKHFRKKASRTDFLGTVVLNVMARYSVKLLTE